MNAASLLDSFFRSSNKSIYDPRSMLLALYEVEEHIEVWEKTGAPVVPFLEALPVWRAEVYHYIDPASGQFANYGSSDRITKGDLGVLSWAAERIAVSSPESTEESRQSIRDLVQGARAVLLEDSSIPEKLRLHISRLLHHVEEALDNYEITGDFLLEDAVERLLGALQLVETASSEPGKWAKFRSEFVPGLASQLAASGALEGIAFITAHVSKALTS
jgi:hypothetical protein